jgi:hypothetical protein
MNIDEQIEQTKLALQILEGRKQGTEPEWEARNPDSQWLHPTYFTNPTDPLRCLAKGCSIRLKPEPKLPTIKLGDWIRDSEVLEEYLVTGSRNSSIRINGQWTKLSNLRWNNIQISRDQGATWTSIKEDEV